MLSDLAQLEQRARNLYAPTMVTRSNGITFVQCERDDMAEARAKMRARLAPVAQAAFYFVADLCLLPNVVVHWVRQWRAG
jgi:hypothetical protein